MTISITMPRRSRAQLGAVDVHLARDGHPVLRGVDLAVTPGSRLGVVGRTGAASPRCCTSLPAASNRTRGRCVGSARSVSPSRR